MGSQRTTDLYELSWPASRLDEAVAVLAEKAGFLSNPAQVPKFPEHREDPDNDVVGQWMSVAASRLGIETEAVESSYAEVDQMVRRAGPALLRLPGGNTPRFLALLRGGRQGVSVLTPEFTVRRLRSEDVRDVLTYELEEPLIQPIQQLLSEAGVPEERQTRAQTSILHEQLSADHIGGCWILRMSPGDDFWKQIRHARLPRYFLTILGMHLIGQVLVILGWWVIGRGALEGHFDRVWLFAWALILFSTIPFHLLETWTQHLFSIGIGGLFKQRLLYGILQLEPEEIRHQGAGQFLGIVMESEALESLALGGGLTTVVAGIEIVIAVGVLTLGAGGWLHALLLMGWMGFTGWLCWRYYRQTRDWVGSYREMTGDLVERMVGHRTRVAQEDREHWHDEEDRILNHYLKLSERLDRTGVTFQAVIVRGWLIVGLAGIAYTFISAPGATTAIAISLGGIMLASQALGNLIRGMLSVVGAITAWKQVEPLFQAAARHKERRSVSFMLPSDLKRHAGEDKQPVLSARDLTFRYQAQRPPVLKKCSLQIHEGDRLLLEGPSGSGKTTLSALMTSLRLPESGQLLLWGVDRYAVGSDEWRRRVVTAPQFHENHVLTETFAFNLLMGNRWPPLPEDLEDAEAVCRELGLGDLLDRMPAGFQQMVGESGWQLSHGERSRLYIARALLQQADLIILDESFAALDPENLHLALQCVLRRAPALLVIAHP